MRLWPFGGHSPATRRIGDSAALRTPDRSRLWLPGAGLGLAALVSLLLLPRDSPSWEFIYICAVLLSLVVLFGAALTMPKGIRGVWWSLFAFQSLTLVAQVVYDYQESSSGGVQFPGPADLVSLVAYLPVFVALGVLIHHLNPGRDREAWIDSSILTVAAVSVFGLFLILPILTAPGLDARGTLVAVAYPVLDVAVLSSLIWVLVGGGRPNGALALLTLSFSFTLTADILRDVRLLTDAASTAETWLDVLRAASLITMALAATAPTAGLIARPTRDNDPRVSAPRLALLAFGVLLVPTIVVVRLWGGTERVNILLALASLIVIILAVWRIQILVSTVERQRSVTELVLDSAGDGIVGLDREGFVLFANLAARRMLRCRETDLVGRRFHDVAHHERPDGSTFPWQECPIRDLVSNGQEAFIPGQVYVRRDGTPFPVEIVMSPLVVEGINMGAVQSFRDVSERQHMEELKRQFVSVVSHELRTPLTSIKGSLQMLDSGLVGPLTEEQQELLTMAVSNSERLGQLVNDILDIERLDAGRMPLAPEPTSSSLLARRAAAGILGAADVAGIRLIVDGLPDPDEPDVLVDPHRMLQVLTNLLGNAIKFSDRGSTVRIEVTHSDTESCIAVIDHGRGIPANQLTTVFDRFGQVEANDARREGGTGLGLPIAREIVQRSGGSIIVDSTLGQGSTFTVCLPLLATPATAAHEVTEVTEVTEITEEVR
jgi:PAS domain S-box-containing protein